jgi:chemotaxis protein MotB
MKKINKTLAVLVLLGLLSSCVSNRKFLEETEARKSAQSRADEEATARTKAEADLKEKSEQFATLDKEHKRVSDEYEKLRVAYNEQVDLNKDKDLAHEKLQKMYREMMELSANQKKDLDRQLSERTTILNEREAELRRERDAFEKLKKDLEGKDASISDLNKYKKELEEELAGREKRIKDLESAIKERDAQTEALRSKLYDALKGFADAGDLGVEIRNGKVYVSLSQKLLFASGSSKIDKRGLDALKSIAGVLSKSTELSILVEGHTDSDGDDKLNWDLSSNRAMSVTQELIKNGVEPARLSAAGRGEHAPKASNSDEKGKAVNRRTEIILEPKLDQIMGILNK